MADDRPDDKVNQFALPHGLGGHVAGYLMAAFNADMERAAVSALAFSPTDAALEIGFGPGVGIRVLTRRLPRGFVAGIDPSEVMLAQATRRNGAAIRHGNVELRLGTAESLPWESDRFNGVCSVNNIQEWTSLDGDLTEVRRVLRPGGRLSIAVHQWVDKYAKDRGDRSRPWADHIVAALRRAGFLEIRAWTKRALSGRALYFSAQK